MRWDEVLTDRLLIGAGRMKTGTAHEVPLLPAIAAALPEKIEGAEGSVFGRRGTGFSGWSKGKTLLDANLAKTGGDNAALDTARPAQDIFNSAPRCRY